MTHHSDDFHHPRDTLLSSALRFLSELIAWVAGPWAVAQWSPWLVIPVLVVLVGLPSVFSTPNDKRNVVVGTPGPVRVGLELLLYAVALVAPWFVWPTAHRCCWIGSRPRRCVAGSRPSEVRVAHARRTR